MPETKALLELELASLSWMRKATATAMMYGHSAMPICPDMMVITMAPAAKASMPEIRSFKDPGTLVSQANIAARPEVIHGWPVMAPSTETTISPARILIPVA